MEEFVKKLDPKNDKQFGVVAVIAVAALAIDAIVVLCK